MLKRTTVILCFVLGLLFLLACSKSNHETLAFIGDESEMKTCYQIYPEQYFPNSISQDLFDGRFPPDLTGEYEMDGSFVDGYCEYYNQLTHQYVAYPPNAYPPRKSMYIIISEQVNGMAKIKFSVKRQNDGDYKDWYETSAYIYGNIYSDNNSEFVLCYDSNEDAGIIRYYYGNIIKGTIDVSGIKNIETWMIIKDRKFTSETHGMMNVGGQMHYYADIAERQ